MSKNRIERIAQAETFWHRTLQEKTRLWTRVVVLGTFWAAASLHANQVVLTYVGTSSQQFIVPANVFSLQVTLWGAGGGSAGGAGGYVTAMLAVTPNEDLTVIVGGGGRVSFGLAAVLGGYGGGGAGTGLFFTNGAPPSYGGSGGGATSITLAGATLLDAAGGGGGGSGGFPGGGGGGLIGQGGVGFPGGGGGTQTAGGTNTGLGVNFPCNFCNGGFGFGGAGNLNEGGGGGGGGYYGGAGGGSGVGQAPGGTVGSGGGGSSYIGGPGVSIASTLPGSQGNFFNGSLPANISDPNYQSGVGAGGAYSVGGGNGLAVLSWTEAQVPEPSTSALFGVSLLLLAASGSNSLLSRTNRKPNTTTH